MVRVLIAGVLALLISILIAPRLIAYLRKRAYGLHIREEGLDHHIVKAGTPTLGGLAILAALSVAFLSLSHYTTNALLVFFVTLGCAAIGFLDDAIKLTHKRSLGLNGRWKLLLLAVIAVVVGIVTVAPRVLDRPLPPGGELGATPLLGLVCAALPHDRRDGECRELHRRARRSRSGNGDHRRHHVHGDGGHRLDPVGRAR